ncbi:response regulator [Rhizobium sp. EC-SD404]|uniref:response regulator transcription factor n=1 Tax=Rhizobium sp. EC-SD404 TaxID=2038389 RepID=UPI001254E92B|nr:response regulator [Rhizobium sp. EC-SD404]VVS96648.1 Response regulator protein TodT [Rhizobium sp. EC-SD404]
MTDHAKLIHVVDDDAAVLDALGIILRMEGYEVQGFESGDAFVRAIAHRFPDCLLLDVHMPGRSGLDILRVLEQSRFPAPVIVITGQGDIPMAVQAVKLGALDFLEKPFDVDRLIERVRQAIDGAPADSFQSGFAGDDRLSEREAEVLAQVVGGARDKEAAIALGISPRTVEAHRKSIMAKLGARTLADLLRIVYSKRR